MTEILAIDDDREILAVIKKALLREGYQVTALEDPLQLEEDKLGRYQLILLDVMMPGIDGFDLCRRIREKVDCPILFLTAKTEEKDVMTGLGAGGDDYITKPFGIGELRARVAVSAPTNPHAVNFNNVLRFIFASNDFCTSLLRICYNYYIVIIAKARICVNPFSIHRIQLNFSYIYAIIKM